MSLCYMASRPGARPLSFVFHFSASLSRHHLASSLYAENEAKQRAGEKVGGVPNNEMDPRFERLGPGKWLLSRLPPLSLSPRHLRAFFIFLVFTSASAFPVRAECGKIPTAAAARAAAARARSLGGGCSTDTGVHLLSTPRRQQVFRNSLGAFSMHGNQNLSGNYRRPVTAQLFPKKRAHFVRCTVFQRERRLSINPTL